MSHYFINDEKVKDQPFTFSFTIKGKNFELESNQGVFSKDKLDEGTKILLNTVLDHETSPKMVLDLGCGIGVIGVVLSHFWKTEMTMIDINTRACELAKKNLEKYSIHASLINWNGIKEGFYECILLNPPIRTGKKTIYSLFDQCLEHLDENGRLWIVMRKQHGAQSAVKYFEENKATVERVARDKGYWIMKIMKTR